MTLITPFSLPSGISFLTFMPVIVIFIRPFNAFADILGFSQVKYSKYQKRVFIFSLECNILFLNGSRVKAAMTKSD